MRIRLLTSICGPGLDLGYGAETEAFSDAEAIRLIESGQAEPVAEPPERAVKRPVEERDAGKGVGTAGADSTLSKGARKRKGGASSTGSSAR